MSEQAYLNQLRAGDSGAFSLTLTLSRWERGQLAEALFEVRLTRSQRRQCIGQDAANISPSPSGIQLLGFSQRVIKVLRHDEQPKLRHRKPCPTTVNTLGEKLRIKRLEMGLTQPETATKLGVSKLRLSLWERGYSQPTDVERSNLVALLKEQTL